MNILEFFFFIDILFFVSGAAGIISFGGLIPIQGGKMIILPCLMQGNPQPLRRWIPKSLPHNTKILPDGSIQINNSQKIHQRNFTCISENSKGSDEITYSLLVKGMKDLGL